MRELIIFMNEDIPMWTGKEIIRCKDCRYWDREGEYCNNGYGLDIGVTENDYCSRAGRREESEVEE